jgi:hypothetical protein
MPRGRPSRLTPDRQNRLCEAIAAGNYYQDACVYAGVSYPSLRRWLAKGSKARRGRFRRLYEAVQQAEATCEVAVVALWQTFMAEDWRAARDFLARRWPKHWALRRVLSVRARKSQPPETIIREIAFTPRPDPA